MRGLLFLFPFLVGSLEPLTHRTFDLCFWKDSIILGTTAGVGVVSKDNKAFWLKLPGSVVTLTKEKDQLLVFLGPPGLYVYDLPLQKDSSPKKTFSPPGGVMDGKVMGDYLILAGGTRGVWIYGWQEGNLIKQIPLPGYARRVILGKNKVYIASRWGGFFPLNLKNLSAESPFMEGKKVMDGEVVPDGLVIALGSEGWVWVDKDGKVRQTLTTDDSVHDLAWDGKYLYTAEGQGGFSRYRFKKGKWEKVAHLPTRYMANRLRQGKETMALIEDARGYRIIGKKAFQ